MKHNSINGVYRLAIILFAPLAALFFSATASLAASDVSEMEYLVRDPAPTVYELAIMEVPYHSVSEYERSGQYFIADERIEPFQERHAYDDFKLFPALEPKRLSYRHGRAPNVKAAPIHI